MLDNTDDVVKETPLDQRFPRLYKIGKVLGFFLFTWWIYNYFADGFEKVSEENDIELSRMKAHKEFAKFLAIFEKSYDDPEEYEERR